MEDTRSNRNYLTHDLLIAKSQIIIPNISSDFIQQKLNELRKTPKILEMNISPKFEQEPIS